MKLKRCKGCRIYTLRERCPECGAATASPHPSRFSPLDPYGKYRRLLKMEAAGEKT